MAAKELMADLADSAMALRTIVKQLPDQAWQVRVRVLDSAPFPAAGLLTWRLAEVELHHCDLGTGYSPADWPTAFATMELAEPMRSQRQDRLRYPPPPPGARPAFPGRPQAPWKPGQRLPGSWLGTGDDSRPLPASRGPGRPPFAMIAHDPPCQEPRPHRPPGTPGDGQLTDDGPGRSRRPLPAAAAGPARIRVQGRRPVKASILSCGLASAGTSTAAAIIFWPSGLVPRSSSGGT